MMSIAAISMLPPFDFAGMEARAERPAPLAAAWAAWKVPAKAIVVCAAALESGLETMGTPVPKGAGTQMEKDASAASAKEPGFFSKAWGAVKDISGLLWTALIGIAGGAWAAGNVIWKIAGTLAMLGGGFLLGRETLRLIGKAGAWAIRKICQGIAVVFQSARRALREMMERGLEDHD